MIEICAKEKCTGCMACMNICTKNAISFQQDKRGFFYPVISNTCVGCGACKKICPSNIGYQGNESVKKVMAAFTKDKEIRKKSSSGGIFTELAKVFIQEGGVVFGTKMHSDMKKAYFSKCESLEELSAFRGSKYVQSEVNYIFREVKTELKTGRNVLFVGVPCQVAGLKNYLGNYPENLYTVDIICHGVPSAGLWRKYVEVIENKCNNKAVNVSFREKKPSWTEFSLSIDFENGKRIVNSKFKDPYLIGFLKELSMRENCYECKFTNTDRPGDITLGDFWGYKSTNFKMRNTEEGISLVLINNEKGQRVFNSISTDVLTCEKNLKEAMSGNRSLKESWKKNPQYDQFWQDYEKNPDVMQVMDKYCKLYKVPLKMRLNWFALNHFYLIPKPLLSWRKKLREGR